jgi:heme/copper-type cytochrome/quinol oxidase subunit 3
MRRLDTAHLAVAIFVLSEAVFFGFLIAAYIYYMPATVHGPTARNSLDPARELIFTICLLASSGTLLLAERRLAGGSRNGFRLWLGATIALGAIFLAGQGIEYTGLIERSVTPERNLFGASFFTLTGFHGFHVFCGVAALATVMGLTFRPTFGAAEGRGIGALAIYWHFVDAIWIVIFSLVYLTVWL